MFKKGLLTLFVMVCYAGHRGDDRKENFNSA